MVLFLPLKHNSTVAVNDWGSPPVPICCGVPHGRLWDPFSLFWIPLPSPMLSTVTLGSSPLFYFADDSQLQKSAPLPQLHERVQYLQECIHNVKPWVTHNILQLNNTKTEALIIPVPRTSNSTSFPDSLVAEDSTVGVSLPAHVSMLTWSELLTVNCVVSAQYAITFLFKPFVLFRLDYCDFLLAGLPKNLI